MEATKMRYAAGIDVGGTFIKLALVSEKGDLLYEHRLSIGEGLPRDSILDTIHEAIRLLLDHASRQGIHLEGLKVEMTVGGAWPEGGRHPDQWSASEWQTFKQNEAHIRKHAHLG